MAWRTGSIGTGDDLDVIISLKDELIVSISMEKSLNTEVCNLSLLIAMCEALSLEAPETVSRKSQRFACVKSERI